MANHVEKRTTSDLTPLQEKEETPSPQEDLFSYAAAHPSPLYLTISELTSRIREVLESNVGAVCVRGEISNLRAPGSGHLYFTLKDSQSQVTAVLFRQYQQSLRFELADGLDVIATGQITVYEPRGIYQILVENLEPVGIGSLQLAFEQLKEKLAKEGLFDPKHKKPIPFLPRKIAVITSPSGAAIRDILNVLHRRFSNLEVLLVPVSVQGNKAAPEIAQALDTVNRHCRDVEVIILGRGGGSLEDLWPFNEEIVARAVFASTIPIISAVGHEIDFTISDFVADLRTPTPSAAAELVVQNKTQLILRTDELSSRLRQAIDHLLEGRKNELFHLTRRLGNPIQELKIRAERLVQIRKNLELIMRQKLELFKNRIDSATRLLHSLSPRVLLDRGYAIVRRESDHTVIRSTSDLDIGELFTLQLSDGDVTARTEKINPRKPS
ncbi:MAG: exodeoxyribonuclease VII large subunit [Deltaproteobacteria bacterium]|nr:exodeoxyribonuclease VII large subunit [Deltaproteobacteria bacterium]